MKQPDKSIDAQMEDVAYQPASSHLDSAGKPTHPVLEIDEILQSEPRYVWWDIEYQGKVQAIQVMKGQIIHYLGTLDDAELLLIAPIYDKHNDVPEPDDADDTPEDTDDTETTGLTPAEDRSFMESVEYSRALKLHNDFILKTFIKGVTKENLESLPDDLKTQMLKAYDGVNGISATNKAVQRFPSEGGE